MIVKEGKRQYTQAKRTSTGEALARVADVTTGLRDLMIHHLMLSPGHRCSPRHYHSSREEFMYVLAGTPTLIVNDAKTVLAVGDGVSFPPVEGVFHAIVNESAAPVMLLEVRSMPEDDAITFDAAEMG